MKLNDLKNSFFNLFRKNKYLIKDIKSVFNPFAKNTLYTNSGIVGIYELFENKDLVKDDFIATSQTCLRVNGKHNDIENIGKTKFHLSCFNMLGTFNFNNIDKVKIIKDIYIFLTLHLNKDNLIITVHPEDKETKSIWENIIDSNKIQFDDKNWWQINDNDGFAGYCTEIYYQNKKQTLEIWNIVIINKKFENGELKDLGYDMIDTGGGLERILSCIMNVDSVFELEEYIDFFNNVNSKEYYYYKIILDHIIAIDKIVSSGIILSSNKHGYILKKFLRKSAFIINKLKININKLISNIQSLKLIINEKCLKKLLINEVVMTNKCIDSFKFYIKNKSSLNNLDLHKLNDTYGIIPFIVEDLAKENNIEINLNQNEDLINNIENKNINNNEENLESTNKKDDFNIIINQTNIKKEKNLILNENYVIASNSVKNIVFTFIKIITNGPISISDYLIDEKYNILKIYSLYDNLINLEQLNIGLKNLLFKANFETKIENLTFNHATSKDFGYISHGRVEYDYNSVNCVTITEKNKNFKSTFICNQEHNPNIIKSIEIVEIINNRFTKIYKLNVIVNE